MSGVFSLHMTWFTDNKLPHGYKVTDYPPSSDESDFVEFEVYDYEPLQTYYVQPSTNSRYAIRHA